MMKVLAFDTALFSCSVALYDAEVELCVASEQTKMMRGQAEALVPMVQSILEKAGAAFSDVDLISTTVGPGAFTGLRIALSTAQGFSLALKKPVIGVSTLEILAAQYFSANELPENHLLCVLIETKRQDYYCQFFNADGSEFTKPEALSGEAVRDIHDAQNVVYTGDATGRFADRDTNVCDGYDFPDPCVVASMGFEKYKKNEVQPLEPLYLRGADVSVSKKIQRVILES